MESLDFDTEYQRGIDLFNQREFFECHDVFEDLWHDERGERRLFLQGLIQAAVGCYHLSNGNTSGAISQYRKSIDKLSHYPGEYLGLELETLRLSLEECLSGAEAMHAQGLRYEVDPGYFPVMKRV
jgi:predicted metal-dependent hydrolase